MKTVIELKKVTKSFSNTVAVKDVDFAMFEKESVAIIGPSGSGKSTLLRLIAGLETPDSGTIALLEEKVFDKQMGRIKHKKHIYQQVGMVFQEGYLFDHLSVKNNLLLAPRVAKSIPVQNMDAVCLDLLQQVQLTDKLHSYPLQLSGGEKQRIAIARALAMKPAILLFDEPTSALDVDATEELVKIIQKLQREEKTMLIVTHDIQFAMKCTSRLLFMEKSSIIVDEKTEFYLQSKNERFLEFIAKR